MLGMLMLRVQAFKKFLANVLLSLLPVQEIIKKIGEAGFNEASNGLVPICIQLLAVSCCGLQRQYDRMGLTWKSSRPKYTRLMQTFDETTTFQNLMML